MPTVTVDEGVASLDGLAFFSGDVNDLKARVHDLLNDGGVHLVVTTNTDQIIDFGKSETLSVAYHRASLRLVDGKPLESLVRLLGGRCTKRITGADLLPTVAEWSSEEDWRVAIVGGVDEVGELAAQNLRAKYQGSRVEHIPFPYTTDTRSQIAQEVAMRLHEYRPNVSFICLGSPKQEDWVIANMDILPEGIFVGAGAAVDFAAGVKSRAPSVIQSIGMEWMWRLLQEPRRLCHRYIVKGPAFIPVIFKSIWGNRK